MKATPAAYLSAIQGKLGSLCGKVKNGKQNLTLISKPYEKSGGGPSAAQLATQAKYAEKVQQWRDADPASRASWDASGAPLGISGFNFLVTLTMGTWADFDPMPVWGEGDPAISYQQARYIVVDKVVFFYITLVIFPEVASYLVYMATPTVPGAAGTYPPFFCQALDWSDPSAIHLLAGYVNADTESITFDMDFPTTPGIERVYTMQGFYEIP